MRVPGAGRACVESAVLSDRRLSVLCCPKYMGAGPEVKARSFGRSPGRPL